MSRGQRVINTYFLYMNRLKNNHSSDRLSYIHLLAQFLQVNERIMPKRLVRR